MTLHYPPVYQPSLLEAQIMPAHNGTVTSVAAAAQAIPNVGPQKRRILAYLNEQGDYGSTQNQASRALNIPENTVHPRFNEMADDHWIEPTTGVRNTQYGKAARVYVITSKGREVLEASEGNGDGHPVGAKG